MNTNFFIVTALLLLLIVPMSFGADTALAGMELKQTDKSLALVKADKVVWQLNYGDKEGKPYFHPLRLPDGSDVTDLRPADHPWHLGLWWSWKYINGVNYWEFDKKTGKYQGITEVTKTKVTKNSDLSAKVELELSYHLPKQPPVLTEQRVITIPPPDAAGSYTIDWNATFTVGEKDVKLDRTPPYKGKNGVSSGGYAGLSVRFSAEAKEWTFINSSGARGVNAVNGKHATWVDFSGKSGGVAIFDLPKNLRHPSPWYCNQTLPYFSPAILYEEPLTLPAGKTLSLQYHLLVHGAKVDLAKEGDKYKEK